MICAPSVLQRVAAALTADAELAALLECYGAPALQVGRHSDADSIATLQTPRIEIALAEPYAWNRSGDDAFSVALRVVVQDAETLADGKTETLLGAIRLPEIAERILRVLADMPGIGDDVVDATYELDATGFPVWVATVKANFGVKRGLAYEPTL